MLWREELAHIEGRFRRWERVEEGAVAEDWLQYWPVRWYDSGQRHSISPDSAMNAQENHHLHPLNRRAFLQGGTLLLAGSALLSGESSLAATDDKPKLRVGLVTDLHYADKEASGSRYYRETLTKFAEVVKHFDQEKPDLIICLGDNIDSAHKIYQMGQNNFADPVLLQYNGGKFVTIAPPQAAVAEAIWPMP